MNENEPTDSKPTPPESNEPTAAAEAKTTSAEPTAAEAKAEPKTAEATSAKPKPETEPSGKPALDAAKEKAREAAAAIKAHDFKGDARKAATGAKNLWKDLRKHDYKAEIRETFAKAKKDPSSLWRKPETPRPGKDLAIAGLAVAGAGLFLLLVTSGAFIGFVCLVLGLVALFAGVLGFSTEGRSLAFAGAGAGVLAVLMSIAQIHSATRKPDPRDELIRLLSAQLAQASDQSVSKKDVADLLARIEAAKSGKSEQSAEDLADAVSKLQALTSTLEGGAAETVAAGLGQLLAGGSPSADGGGDSFEATRARVAADPSLTVPVLNLPGLAPRSPTGELLPQAADSTQNDSSAAQRPFVKIPNAFGEESAGRTGGKNKDKFGHGFRTQDEDPPAGPSAARNKEVQQVLKKAKIETMTVDLPNKVGLLLTKLPDGSFMGTFEVTQDQWLSVMGGENPSGEDNVGNDHPVDSIWPADAMAFVEKLNALPAVREAGLQFRIPSEEEWEKACLAGNKKSRDYGLRLDGEKVTKKNFGEIAWCSDNFTRPSGLDPDEGSVGISHSVGRRQPNAFGLYDTHGNVEELVFAKDARSNSRFTAKGGHWSSGSDSCEAYKHASHIHQEPVQNYSGAKPPTNYSLGLRVAASILDKDIARILAAGEKVAENGGAAFFGFYPGMSEEDATKLAKHYGLALDDDPKEAAQKQPSRSYHGPEEIPALCQFVVDPVTKRAIQIRFNLSSILLLTKETDCKFDFQKLCNAMTKYIGELECIQDGNGIGNPKIYGRKTESGIAISLENDPSERAITLALEDSAGMAALAAARMAAANNARIAAVEPVLQKAGIKTKTIELPGGVKLLLTMLPNERYLGTFEVTQAQYFSLMGANASQCVGADLPVDSVTVRDCLDFVAKLNELPAAREEELRFRLPSLAEWAEACRAGTEGDYTKRLDGTEVDKKSISIMMNPSDAGKTAERGPHSVGAAIPNAFGLYDMFGNVSEWVSDKLPDNPHHPDDRFHMGGSWSETEIKPIKANEGRDRYSSNYRFDSPDKVSPSIGFRVSVVSWPREIQRAKDEAAKAYALSNNGRIDAVKPVLEKAGIATKEVELPGGVRMLLNKTPDGAWAAAFEITQAQWKSLLHDNPASFQGDPLCTDDIVLEIWRSWKDNNPEKLRGTGLPVDQVSPGDVRTFILLLNALSSVRDAGLTLRLPTQDEWLYVALAGAKSAYAKPLGGGDASVDLMGWNKENVETPKSPRLQIVGQKQPNAFGLYDVHGNVSEFTESHYCGRINSFYGMGGSVGTMFYDKSEKSKNLALRRPIGGHGVKLEEHLEGRNDAKIPDFTGFRLVATEGGVRHLVDPEMAAANNARIDAVKPVLDAKGIETKVLDLPGGVKLLLTKLPGEFFWAGTFEVTQAQFLSILGENPSIVLENRRSEEVFNRPWLYRTGDRPVDNVGKGAAEAFLRELGALPCAKDAGLAFHLPFLEVWEQYSGAQWKKIPLVLGGLLSQTTAESSPYLVFPGGKTLLDMAWVGSENRSGSFAGEARIVLDESAWSGLSRQRAAGDTRVKKDAVALSQPVGTKEPNPYGLYDMIGNVWEWTSTTKFELQTPRDEEWKKQHLESEIRGAEMADEEARRWFVTAGASFKTHYTKDMFKKSEGRYTQIYEAKDGDEGVSFLSVDLRNEQPGYLSPGAVFEDVGFRVWGSPVAKRDPSVETSSANAGPNPFAQDSNARIDAVKPVLDKAGIETKEIELPGGVRILMNKLPNGTWMAAFETTQAQFASVFGRNPSRKVSRGGDRAVENVSWNAATVYASVLNRLPSVKASGLHFRLPSSTEWEYACRGGGGLAPQGKPLEKSKGKLEDMGWYDRNSDIEGVGQTHRVGQLQPNAFGLYDMIGNVGEWTATAYSQRAAGDHTVGSRRIWRGGNWSSPKERCTAAWRGLLPSDAARPDTGFRLYATEDGSDPKDENVVFRDKEYKDAIEPGPLPDDRTSEQKLIGALLDLQTEMQKAELQLQMEEARFELELMGIDPDSLF